MNTESVHGPLATVSSPGEAVALFTGRLREVGTERVPLGEAAGRVLAGALVADRASPAVDVSAMDGYAVNTTALRAGRAVVTGEIRIGQSPPALGGGGVLRIVTGAPMPRGADAVIKREDVEELGDAIVVPETVAAGLKAGASVRRAGENIAPGGEVVGAGQLIGAPVCGALASFSCWEPLVRKRVRVGVLVTGDELVGEGSEPTPWQLRDSNGPAIAGMLSGCGWVEMGARRRGADSPDELRAAVEELLADSDAVVVTGGVSMGDRDFVPRVLRQVGCEVLFHKVPQRPGRPVLGAVAPGGKPVMALPGNPLSVMVTARRMLVPVLARLAGLTLAPPAGVTLVNADDKSADLWWHRLVRLSGDGRAELVDVRGSGDVVGAARSDGFIEVPPGRKGAGPWALYGWTI